MRRPDRNLVRVGHLAKVGGQLHLSLVDLELAAQLLDFAIAAARDWLLVLDEGLAAAAALLETQSLALQDEETEQ